VNSASRKILLRLSLAISAILTALIVLEVFLRVTDIPIARHSDHMFTLLEHDSRLGWKMKANIHAKVDFFDVENIPVRSNSIGYWDTEFIKAKHPTKFRVALLGDSFTWGYGVRENERFGNILQEINGGIEVLNFGIPAYGTDQALITWRQLASSYNPDAVILTVYNNDYIDNLSSVRWGRPKPYFIISESGSLLLMGTPVDTKSFYDTGILHEIALPYRALFPSPITRRSRILDWLVKNSDVVRLTFTLVLKLQGAFSKMEKEEPSLPSSLQVEQIRIMSGLVQQLATEVKDEGAKLLVVLAGEHNTNYEYLKSHLLQNSIMSLDATSPVLSMQLGKEKEDLYSPYHFHWKPESHRVVADLIYRQIASLRNEPRGISTSPNLEGTE